MTNLQIFNSTAPKWKFTGLFRAILQNPDVVGNTSLTNLLIDDFWGTSLKHVGTHGSYRPLTVLTFRMTNVLFGLNSSLYHVTNVFLHSFCVFLLCHVTRSLLKFSTYKSFLTGIIFAVHPVHTEAVAGIVGRADVLATIFCLTTLISYKFFCDELSSPKVQIVDTSQKERVSAPKRQIQTLRHGIDSKSKKKKKKKRAGVASSIKPSPKSIDTENKLKLKSNNKQIAQNENLTSQMGKVDVDPTRDSECGSDDSRSTADTYDSISSRSSTSGESDLISPLSLSDGQLGYKEINQVFDAVDGLRKRRENVSSSTQERKHFAYFSSRKNSITNTEILIQNSHEESLSFATNPLSKKHCWKAYLWFFLAISNAACALLSKEQGYCALPLCIVYDVMIRNRLGLKGSLSLLYRKTPPMKSLRRRLFISLILALLLITFRIGLPVLLAGRKFSLPRFSSSDNPAAASDDFLTRTLTFNYLLFCNAKLLLLPTVLSFDWSMDAIPLITDPWDARNVQTSLLYFVVFLFVKQIWIILRRRDCDVPLGPDPWSLGPSLNPATIPPRFGTRRFSNNSCDDDSSSLHIDNKHFRGKNHKLHFKRPLAVQDSGLQFNDHDLKTNKTSSLSVFECEMSVIFAVAILSLSLLPATNLLFYVGFVLAERLLYLPSIGTCILVTEIIFSLETYLSQTYLHPMTDETKQNCRIHPKRNPLHSNIFDPTSKRGTLQYLLWAVVGFLLIAFSAQTWCRNAEWKNEKSLYSSGIEVNPAKAWGNLGNVLRSEGQMHEAMAAYTNALKHRPNMADVQYNLGLLHQESSRHEMAVECYKQAIRFRPKMALAYLNLGVVMSKQGRTAEAKTVYRKAALLDDSETKDPQSHAHAQISALYNLGCIHAEEGDHETAVSVYKEALRIPAALYKPHSLYNMLGQSLFELRRIEEAEEAFKKAMAAKPDHVPTHLTYARLLDHVGHFDQSKNLYVRALKLEPENLNIYKHFSNFYSSHNKFSEAAKLMLSAAETPAGSLDYETVFNTASACRQAKLNEIAEEYYFKAVNLAPKSPTAHMNYGAILHLHGKYVEAKQSYLKALELKPGDGMILENLSKLKRAQKEK